MIYKQPRGKEVESLGENSLKPPFIAILGRCIDYDAIMLSIIYRRTYSYSIRKEG